MKYIYYLFGLMLLLVAYVGYVTYHYKPVKFETTTSNYHRNETQLNKEVTDDSGLYDLDENEQQEVKETIIEQRNIAKEGVEKQTVEQMRNEVHEILDEIIKTDSTVTISFNMTVENPLHR